MRTVKKVAMLVVAAGMLGGVATAFAQDQVIADVGFSFMLSGKSHPAGQYEVVVLNDEQTVELRGPNKSGGLVAVMSRLSAPESRPNDGSLVFDKVGDTYLLSEVWLPGQDGFLISAAKEKHSHSVVKLQRSRR